MPLEKTPSSSVSPTDRFKKVCGTYSNLMHVPLKFEGNTVFVPSQETLNKLQATRNNHHFGDDLDSAMRAIETNGGKFVIKCPSQKITKTVSVFQKAISFLSFLKK